MNIFEKLVSLVPPHHGESTTRPIWFIGRKFLGKTIILSRGVWFEKSRAEKYLDANRGRYHKKAKIMRVSGFDSSDIMQLHQLAYQANLELHESLKEDIAKSICNVP